MSYIINKTNGDVLTEIVDGSIDQLSTDLTLIGKNTSSYGELFNENFVHILENFANTSSPNNPIQGQLWYDTSEGRLKIYDGAGWKVSSGTVVSPNIPTLTQGDLWIDSTRQQLYFNDGSSTLLAGPIYNAQQGISGFQVIDIVDTNSLNHTVVLMYVAQSLIGIFSKDRFTPVAPIVGWSGSLWSSSVKYVVGDRVIYVVDGKPLAYEVFSVLTSGPNIGYVPAGILPTDGTFWKQIFINPGFNAGTTKDVKFHVPTTQADSLIANDGTVKTSSSFLSATDESTTAIGNVIIQNDIPLKLGPQQNSEIHVDNNLFSIVSNTINQDFAIVTQGGNGLLNSFYVDAQNQRVGILTDTPISTLDVSGDVRITGNLTVEGLTSNINSTNLIIEDKQIELGTVNQILNISGTITSSLTTTTLTSVSSVTGLIAGQTLTKISGSGAFGTNAKIVSVDSTTQITIIADTANTGGSLSFSVGGATDSTADGGGILVRGATNKSFSWDALTAAWKSSENINLISGKNYQINGFTVLSQSALGVTVTSAPGLISVGNLTTLQAGYLNVTNSTVSYVNASVGDGTIYIAPKNNGTVDVSSKRITNVQDPSNSLDAVNLQTMQYNVQTYAQSFSINQGALSDATIASTIVTKMCPVIEHQNNALVRVWCLDTLVAKQFTLVNGSWAWSADL
jgi:hypothetical protein